MAIRYAMLLLLPAVLTGVLTGAGTPLEPATTRLDDPIPADGAPYRVSRFDLEYLRDNPGLPPIASLDDVAFTLGVTDAGFVAPRSELETQTMTIAEANARGETIYYSSALQVILERISARFLDSGIMGVFVAPSEADIDADGNDLRGGGQYQLRIIITIAMAREMRTVASGERFAPAQRIDHPHHRRILDRSPVQPFGPGGPDIESLLRKDRLDDYLFHLGRHQGRIVDLAVAPTEEPGLVALDFHVTENRPLTLYAQISNTGTRQTSQWRERFGLFHTQLTNRDDILHLDYSTAGFDDSHAVTGSYEAPLFDNDRVRWRVGADWSEYTASDVGFLDADFAGNTWGVEAELIANVHQNRDLFIDLFAGLRYERERVTDGLTDTRGVEQFLLPRVGARLERCGDWYDTHAELGLEFQVLGVDDDEVAALGRTDPDENWTVLRGSLQHSFYLEPALRRSAWEDPTTPESSTLAHELLLRVSGQYAFGDRLVPQHEAVAGGLYTVRGYRESLVAGDSALIGTVEYRYHVPRAFGIEPEPRTLFGRSFRTAPQYVYGSPDWDLVLKAFADVGSVWINDRLSFESNETLVGAGIGVEFLYRRNLHLRLDWGFALEDVEGLADSGDSRLHFVATIYF